MIGSISEFLTAPVLSIALSVPALLLVAGVAVKWSPQAWRAMWRNKGAHDWLVIGIAVGFIGTTVNMAWWTAYYTAAEADYDVVAATLFEWGSTVNVFFRQGALIIAGWCHLRAYEVAGLSSRSNNMAGRWLALSVVVGFTFAWFLTQR